MDELLLLLAAISAEVRTTVVVVKRQQGEHMNMRMEHCFSVGVDAN